MTDRLHVDWTRCEARGLCLELVPELLAADDWGYPLSRTRDAAPAVPPRLAGHAERAVAECRDSPCGSGRIPAGRLEADPEHPRGRGPTMPSLPFRHVMPTTGVCPWPCSS